MLKVPQCEHEKLGRVLAHSYSTAANASHIAELTGKRVEGLGYDAWRSIMANYRAQMDHNIMLHRAECEGKQ